MRSSGAGPRRAARPPTPAPVARSPVGGWPIAAAIAVVAIVLYAVRYALLPFVFAAAIGFVADPLVRSLQKRTGMPRAIVASLFCLVLFALFAAFVYWIGINAGHNLADLLARAPAIARTLIGDIAPANGIALFGTIYSVDDIVKALAEAAKLADGGLLGGAGQLTLSLFFGVVLTVVLTPYFMISGPRLAAGAIWLVPPERRGSVRQLLPKIVPVLRRYLVGIVLVVLYTSTAAWLGFGLVFALPNAALLAITVGILELLPVVGPLAAATLVGIVALQQTSLLRAALPIGFVILLRLSIDNLVGPLVLGAATRLHPVVIIAGFVCGAMLFGIVGLLLAVPTTVAIKVTLQHYYAEPIMPEPR